MKKFYSYGMAALLSLTATTASATVMTRNASAESVTQSAQSTVPLSSATVGQASFESAETVGKMPLDFNQLRTVASQGFVGTSRRQAAPAKATEIGATWTSVGTAKYTDGVVCAIFTSVSAETWDVELEQNDAAPGVYRLVNPYTCDASPYASFKNTTADNYMVFDATDPKAVILIPSDSQNYQTDLCVTLNSSFGSVYVVPSEWWGGDETGTFGDGIINFPEGTLGAYMPGYDPNNCWDTKNINILFPGAKDYSISVESLTGVCTENGKFSFSYKGGADATNVKYFFAKGDFAANDGNLSYVASSGTPFTLGDGNYTLTCTANGWYTLFFVSLDPSGNVASHACIHVYNRIFNSDDWTSLGMGLFSDDTFCPDYGVSAKIPAYTVEILESKTTPGVYCLVNPYKNHPALNANLVHAHNDYLVVDASDPNAVIIDEQPIGVNVGGDEITLYSLSDGKLVDHVITFPTKGLVYGDGEGYYYANRSGNFYITIPYFELTVKVTDSEGTALESAYVSILNVDNTDAETNAEGTATINLDKALAAGSYTLQAYKDGYEMDDSTPVTIDVKDGEFVYTASITLDEAVCKITVIAADEEGEPIEGAYIYLDGEYQEGVTTGANGQAVVEIKGGFGKTYKVMVGKDGYEPYEHEVEFTEGYEEYVFAKLEQSVCTATFIVLAKAEPAEGATVTVTGFDPVTTGLNGQAVITIKGGFGKTYAYTVTKEGYYDYTGTLEFNAETGIDAYPIVELSEKEARIDDINADAAAGKVVIYNLQGIRLNKVNEAGYYIVNGHKLMIKQ